MQEKLFANNNPELLDHAKKMRREMTAADVKLVVPKSIISAFPHSVQPSLVTLESFIGDIRLLSF